MTVLTGVLNDSGGNPITGSLWLELSQPGIYSPGAILVTPLQPSTFQLTNGQITGPGPGPYQVYGNDGITPSSTWYALTAFDSSGQQVLRVETRITGASVDFGALPIAPTQNWTPPVDPSLTLGGDTTGPLGATVVVRIRGRAVAAPPWTPGHVLAVQGDGSLAFEPHGAQPLDATLTALAGLSTAADRLPYFTGPDAASLTPLSSFMRTLLDDGDQATALSTLGAAAASHSHTGLLSGLTSGYFPRASGAATVVNSPLYTDGTNVGLNQTTPTDMLHATRTAAGGRAALFLESLGAGGYAAVKLGSISQFSEFLVSSGYVGGVAAPGFSIRDTNAGEDRLTIDNTTGEVAIPQSLSVVGTSQGRIRDKGGQVFNVKALGAEGDGSTDDTTAIQAAITAAAAVSPRGVVFFPPGTYNTSGGFSLNGLNGLKILGSGPGSTVIRITHATNDLFSVGATVTSNLEIGGFSVTSDTVTRTGGWVFHVNNAYNGTGMLKKSVIRDLEITKQFNGLGIKKYEFVTLENIFMWDPVGTTGTGIKAGQTTAANLNQGSALYMRGVQVYGNDLAGGSPYLANAFDIEDADAVYMLQCGCSGIYGNGLKMTANSGGHTPANHFFTQCDFDSTKTGHSVYITGTGDVLLAQFTGCWFCSAGRLTGGSTSASGFRVDLSGTIASSRIVGSTFYNTNGNGLRASAGGHNTINVTGNTFESCGIGGAAGHRAAIYANVPSGYIAPLISSNTESSSGLYSIETSATTNKIRISDNMLLTATSYGVAPAVNHDNGF